MGADEHRSTWWWVGYLARMVELLLERPHDQATHELAKEALQQLEEQLGPTGKG